MTALSWRQSRRHNAAVLRVGLFDSFFVSIWIVSHIFDPGINSLFIRCNVSIQFCTKIIVGREQKNVCSSFGSVYMIASVNYQFWLSIKVQIDLLLKCLLVWTSNMQLIFNLIWSIVWYYCIWYKNTVWLVSIKFTHWTLVLCNKVFE